MFDLAAVVSVQGTHRVLARTSALVHSEKVLELEHTIFVNKYRIVLLNIVHSFR